MTRWGSTDYRQLEELRDRIGNMLEQNQQNVDAFCRECARELAQRLYRKVVKRTPVGHKPVFDAPKVVKVKGDNGKIRSFLTKEGEILERYWSGYQGGTLRRGWTVKTVSKRGDDYICEIINPVEYASYVEFGHRQQANRYVPMLGKKLKNGWVEGKYMLTVSEHEIQNMAPKFIERLLQKRLEEMMNG